MTINLNNIITSQDYLNEEIIEAKRAAQDYSIQVSPEFEIDGVSYRVLLDGHHSLAAALEDGAELDVEEMTARDHDAIGLLNNGNIEDFLAATHNGFEFIFAVSHKSVW